MHLSRNLSPRPKLRHVMNCSFIVLLSALALNPRDFRAKVLSVSNESETRHRNIISYKINRIFIIVQKHTICETILFLFFDFIDISTVDSWRIFWQYQRTVPFLEISTYLLFPVHVFSDVHFKQEMLVRILNTFWHFRILYYIYTSLLRTVIARKKKNYFLNRIYK